MPGQGPPLPEKAKASLGWPPRASPKAHVRIGPAFRAGGKGVQARDQGLRVRGGHGQSDG